MASARIAEKELGFKSGTRRQPGADARAPRPFADVDDLVSRCLNHPCLPCCPGPDRPSTCAPPFSRVSFSPHHLATLFTLQKAAAGRKPPAVRIPGPKVTPGAAGIVKSKASPRRKRNVPLQIAGARACGWGANGYRASEALAYNLFCLCFHPPARRNPLRDRLQRAGDRSQQGPRIRTLCNASLCQRARPARRRPAARATSHSRRVAPGTRHKAHHGREAQGARDVLSQWHKWFRSAPILSKALYRCFATVAAGVHVPRKRRLPFSCIGTGDTQRQPAPPALARPQYAGEHPAGVGRKEEDGPAALLSPAADRAQCVAAIMRAGCVALVII